MSKERTIFYSWQSDLPNRTNRGFIQDALERVAEDVRSDDALAIEPVVDRDTAGVPGSPAISDTILQKIGRADVFVPDVSIVMSGSAGRSSPNPNVVMELGYAVAQLGWDRIIMVMNTAFGDVTQLPFDLRADGFFRIRCQTRQAHRKLTSDVNWSVGCARPSSQSSVRNGFGCAKAKGRAAAHCSRRQ